ncbi:MAG: beta-agarase [Phycisphaerae bacterium]|nr:beta-agarase [Phycisphaerae bacterium]NIP55285.1 beta-agarase [Phycisphaerae bacterium]NIS53958.1 beta-agarase [Phycisphaerae bacterium]NIU11566.1 beta-agarase [Phycisphaerae bacterium]NIU59358.1 beta-agarase [Phycisphaerae bacterium]
MSRNNLTIVFTASFLFVAALTLYAEDQAQSLTLFSFDKGFDTSKVITGDAKVNLSQDGMLRIETGTKQNWPGITLKAPEGKWDLSKYEFIKIDIKNMDDKPVTVSCRVDNPGADGRNNCVTENININPNSIETLTVRLCPTTYQLTEPVELIGMRRAPAQQGKLDGSNITQLLVFVSRPKAGHTFEIDNICAGGRVKMMDTKTFFPFIDEFGQFIHKDWPGKTHSQEELIAHGKTEEKDIAANPGPADRNKYGGWTAGPKLKTTSFFRVQKYKGKWWLVDPQGRLFWSHGIDCVRSTNATPISDREHYYRNLPKADSLFSTFYSRGSWAPHGYYKDHSPYRTYDFSRANFLRKYGPDWQQKFADITHRRLKSWGINTIANWSDPKIYLMRKTPYVATISYSARNIEGSQGYWGKFYDVFDPSFRQSLRRRLEREKDTSAGDPWCLGYFVHNELSWGDETSLAVAALISPPDQPAKKVFVEDLKSKYKSIDKLNNAWGTNHKTWNALLQSTEAQDKKKAHNDLIAFYTKTAETYFKTIREEVKKIAPNQLYMGCRFAWVNDLAARAATKFCDIVSYNRYRYSVENHRLPDDIDMPIIIGEFHFGALDRGMFHTGLRKTANQQDRADKYKSYVQGALRNPYIVGTHWFQYKDQATTGRGDGENYQIGFIDICDKPYPETIKACREVGHIMYEYRLKTE